MVSQYVPVAEDEVVDVGVGGEVFGGELNERFSVGAAVRVGHGVEASVLFAPAKGERDGPSGVDGGKELLAEAVAEQGAEKPEARRIFADSVAMGDEEFFAVKLGGYYAVDHLDAQFAGEIVENPYVVVPYEPSDFYAGVSQLGKAAEETGKAAGHHVAVLKPEVEHVADEVDSFGIFGHVAQAAHDAPLGLVGGGKVCSAEMQVAEKVGGFSVHQRKPSSSLASSLIMS